MTDRPDPDYTAVEDAADNVFLGLLRQGPPSATRAEMARMLDVASVAASDHELAVEGYNRG